MPAPQERKTALNKQGEKTREAVLNAAELLFGQRNFDSVSMRDIASEAGVLLGAVGYHFKGKEALYREAAKRRADQVNELRLARLSAHDEPTAHDIIDAYLRPALELHQRPEWHSYMNMLTQVSHDDRWRELEFELFNRNAEVFLAALSRALPEADSGLLRVAFLHGIAVLLDLIRGGAGRLGSPKSTAATPAPGYSTIDAAVDFVTGGLLAVAG